MTGAMDWQGDVGRNWAAEAARTDRSFSGLTPHLLEAIDAEPGNRIVDIGCGAGQLTAAIAAIRPKAHVTGVDISADLVAVAKARCAAMANVRIMVADAARWTGEGDPPQLYVSRHGVMFFDHPPAAFAHLAQIAAPGARIVFSCFRHAHENQWATEIARLLPPPAPVPPTAFPAGPFAFADPDHVRRCMAGWTGFRFAPVDFSYVAGSGSDPVEDAVAFFGRIGPAAAAARALPRTAHDGFKDRLRALVRDHVSGGTVTFRAAAWLVTATADHG